MKLRGKAISLLAGNEVGTFIVCTKCGSTRISHSASKKKILDDGIKRVSYKITCRDCDASAIVEEKWKVNQ